MPRISEVYCVGTKSNPNLLNLAKTQICPIKGDVCDGGGNRYASNIEISSSGFNGLIPAKEICSSVCNIEVGNGENWIVCPRRLFYLGNTSANQPQKKMLAYLIQKSNLSGQIAWWKEAKIKAKDQCGNSFDYTFDYVLAEFDSITNRVISAPVIVEVMTSSTSGGNKRKGTTIPQAFEAVILNRAHTSPSINYRQVWGRMISQFFVKSQVASSWGGKTFWVIQDSLMNYIERSTAFQLNPNKSNTADEINLVVADFGQDQSGNPYLEPQSIEMASGSLSTSLHTGFMSILGTPFTPPINVLTDSLEKRGPDGIIV